MTTGPDLNVQLEEVEYEESTSEFLEALDYKYPPCCGGYTRK